MNLIGKLVNWMGPGFIESFVGKKLVETTYTEEWIANPSGSKVYAHIHRPFADGEYPGVVFVPGALSPGTDYDRGGEVTADDVASLGFLVLHYDPSGRGESGGQEDYWGINHQKELSIVLEYIAGRPDVWVDNIGVFSFSIGITISSGALASYELPFVRYLFDWEGPSNRFNITKNDTHTPLKKFPTSNLAFWKDREPVRFIGDIKCGYFRYQSSQDHMQGSYKGHALELVNLATKGKAKWTRLNDNSPNMLFDKNKANGYSWTPWLKNHKGQLLKYLLEIHSMG